MPGYYLTALIMTDRTAKDLRGFGNLAGLMSPVRIIAVRHYSVKQQEEVNL
ncbi:Uncharacterized protein dnm_061890 [Desulfonema magnum]|uniref:Uncharacterized protein n=1 Tax=Desulfonema magnum TaxID=45655 RepID=A0A975BR95_9BACT|nr:Uncharacterized protein dnm_061890 [Desulfonema magnum]